MLPIDDPLFQALTRVVQTGAVEAVIALLDEHPELATDRRDIETGGHSADEITNAGWHACRGGQLATVQLLVEHGADLEWLGYDGLTSRQAGLQSENAALVAWLGEN